MGRHDHFTPSTYISDRDSSYHHDHPTSRHTYHTNPTPISYDSPQGGFLKRDSPPHRPHHYASAQDHHTRTPVYYDNPQGGFFTSHTLPPPDIHLYTTPHLPLLGHTHPRPHPYTPSQPLQDLGFGPTPLFGWGSVTRLMGGHTTYGQPKYLRYQKPDHRLFCYSVGKADVPYASLPGGPLWGYPAHMAEQLVRR
ncbi:hypothetical protein IAR50_006102 [Cryptococcus sp. DSM 104548]